MAVLGAAVPADAQLDNAANRAKLSQPAPLNPRQTGNNTFQFALANGMQVLVIPDHRAPVVTQMLWFKVGAVDDPPGISGLAHFFEHMMFRGTKANPDDAFSQIIAKNGGENNAFTDHDYTAFYEQIAKDRLPLAMKLEADRLANLDLSDSHVGPERDVVLEERRMRTDSNPFGRLLEQFTQQAFTAHPYHRPGIGWISDLNHFSATDAQKFFDTYYVPSNMVIAIAGDVTPAQALPILEKYFGRLPSRPHPDEVTTTEPPQNSERRIVLKDMSQPIYIEGYHRPDYRSKDDAVFDAITDLLSEGRTSRLYRSLVRDKKIASFSEGFTGYPGIKYPHLFAFLAVPLPGHKPQEIGDAIHAEIERLKKEDISDDELKMIKTRSKANLIRGLADNGGLATQLATYQTRYGDWQELFRSVDRIDAVTKADIRRVANEVFVDTNRTVGVIENAPGGRGSPGAEQGSGAADQGGAQ